MKKRNSILFLFVVIAINAYSQANRPSKDYYTGKKMVVHCLSNEEIITNDKGQLISAYLSENQYFFNGKNATVYCLILKKVSFFNSGVLKSAYLRKSQIFFNGKAQEIEAKKYSPIEFYEMDELGRSLLTDLMSLKQEIDRQYIVCKILKLFFMNQVMFNWLY